jgi:hypothetical protein
MSMSDRYGTIIKLATPRELLDTAVLIVEDTIDATSEHISGQLVPTERTGAAIVTALIEAGYINSSSPLPRTA